MWPTLKMKTFKTMSLILLVRIYKFDVAISFFIQSFKYYSTLCSSSKLVICMFSIFVGVDAQCRQKEQLRAGQMEDCTALKHFDYFTGSEVSYALSFAFLGATLPGKNQAIKAYWLTCLKQCYECKFKMSLLYFFFFFYNYSLYCYTHLFGKMANETIPTTED